MKKSELSKNMNMERPKIETTDNNETSLRKIYQFIIERYPDYVHSEDKFKDSLQITLEEEGIRTRSLRRDIEEKGMDFKISREWPLNDFCSATSRYLISVGVPETEAMDFAFKMNMEKQSFFLNKI